MRDLFAIDGRSIWTELVRARIAAARHYLALLGSFTPDARLGKFASAFNYWPNAERIKSASASSHRFQFSRLVEGASV
jgi:hypothetical protein